ncbi:MAG: pth [Firmicutes bacterium]|nr:pth [Bacillota bacterium]
MKIVVGLGNPGNRYSATRHNVGFMTTDLLAARWEVDNWKNRFDGLVAEYRGVDTVLLIKPQTYMNLSGAAVKAAVNWYKLSVEDVIVIYDDLDLPSGKLRLRTKGGSGGHRGIESILMELGKDDFARVRIGIGRPPQFMATADYVLGRFSPEEIQVVEPSLKRAADAVEAIIKGGMAKAANEYNKG